MRLYESSIRYPNVTLVLYHYPMSPYSEKLRLAMALRGIAWLSIQVSPQPPRGKLDRVLGGYRRIPVLQRGAHFYCDTRLAFEALHDDDPSVTHLDAADETLRDWAEREIFLPSSPPSPQSKSWDF